jgi:hypothetical protein
MGAGLMQLVLYGNISQYITQNPQINYYKYSHNKHTNFSIEQITLKPEGSSNAGFNSGAVINFKIKRYGDFLSNMFLTFKIPDIYSNNEYRFRWITNIGYNYIKEVRIKIGNNTIESLYGEWLNIWDELTNKDGIKYNKLIGNIDELVNPFNFVPKYTIINNRLFNVTYPISVYSSTNNNPSIKGRKIQVPLNFWFTKNPSLALPLLKMQNIEILLEIETNPKGFDGLYQVWSNILNMYVSPVLYEKLHSKSISIEDFVSPNDKSFDVRNELICSYVYLDSIERSKILLNTQDMDYVISTPKRNHDQFNANETTKTITITNASHHIKELIWIVRRNDVIDNFNNYTNYTATHEYTENMGILDNIEIKWNNTISRTDNDAEFYNHIVPYKYHTNVPRTGLYCYSFSLFPEKQVSAGSYDNSRVTTSLTIKTKENLKNNSNVNYIHNIISSLGKFYNPLVYEIVVYAVDVNVLHITNGTAAFRYT